MPKNEKVSKSDPVSKLALGIDEVVAVSSIGRTSIYGLISSGQLKSFRVGGRRLVAYDDLVAFLNSQRGA